MALGALVLSTPAVSAAGADAVHAPVILVSPGADATSTNWSGYAATGHFTSVSSSWVQPLGTCTPRTTYSAFWVGLDGFDSRSVEQTGSSVDCHGGSPTYYAWYEMYPRFPVDFPNPVRPGDALTASVTGDASGTFTLVMGDTTAGWSHTVHASYPKAERASAEVVAEAPSSGTAVLALTDFGTASFTDARIDGSPIRASSPVSITMRSGGTVKAVPSALSAGRDFTVAWTHG